MPYIQFKDQQFPLGTADLTVGAFDGAVARLPGDDPQASALLKLGADGTGLISRGSDAAVVLVNGVRLGAEPIPILHGDKIELGGHQLRFGADEGLRTQAQAQAIAPDVFRSKMGVAGAPTAATGGRLVSLMDGREYGIAAAGVSIGREIGCDIVIGSTEVSRKHAVIAPADGGYVLTDWSTNGVFVNGERVEQRRPLGRGDVVRIGPEEFRFSADPVEPVALAPPVTIAPAAAAPPAAMAVPSLSATGFMPARPARPPAPPVLAPTAPAVPVAPTAPAIERQPIATLEITNEGPTRGTKFDILGLLTNVGRGGHNDVVINDESLSISHAKILKRDGLWWIVDQGSTNGTYVGGKRVQGEQPLVGAPDVRFGGIKMIFRAAPSGLDDQAKGTRAIASLHVEAAKKLSEELRTAATTPPVALKKKGCAAMVAFLTTLGVLGASVLLNLLSTRG